jgi:predicted peptidase
MDLPGVRRMRYLLYLPEGYAAAEPWPLILFLHGGGEAGENLDMVRREGLPRLLERWGRFPFVVVSPLSPRKAWSVPDLLLVLDGVERSHSVDPARVYVTGLSTGALAAWELAIAAPDRVAAIAPVTTHRVPEGLCAARSVPVWAFHNARDARAPVRVTKKAVEAFRACGGDARLTVYPEDGHDAWTRTYGRADLYEWFLTHRREAGSTGR